MYRIVTKSKENPKRHVVTELPGTRSGGAFASQSIVPPGAASHVKRSLGRQWKRYRKELKRCQRKFSEKAVHNSRVAARRLLATLELLEGFLRPELLSEARGRIKEHLDIFDDLRDTQVQLVAATSLQRTFPAAREFCDWLKKREVRFRKKARTRVRRSKTKPLSKLITASEEVFERQLQNRSTSGAARLLLRSVAKAFNGTMRLRQRIRPSHPQTIHRTRVAFKRFRYMVELLGEHLRADEKMIEEMQHYQTMMGDIQDTEVLLQTFDKFIRKKNIRAEPAILLRNELVRKRDWLIQVYMDAAGQLREFWPVRTAADSSTAVKRPKGHAA